jgi:tetratricopeptide (TPR) repeat protein
VCLGNRPAGRGRLDQAEKVFRDFTEKHGEKGSVLTNLAKVYSKRGDSSRAEEILWRGLEVDPNQDNGMGWYFAIHSERSGEEAGQEALRRVAALPNSWRAQLWLARHALKKRDLDHALVYYRESLSRTEKSIPPDLLMQISGDLGNQGHLPELLQLVEPHFVPEKHGLQVGNNLVKAHLDLGQIDAARRILDELFALKRPDWNPTLSYWDTEIAKARLQNEQDDGQVKQIKSTLLTIEGPVWLKPSSPAAELFPAKRNDGLTVSFLGGTAEIATNSKRIQHQLSDTVGRMSRALPLFLAEQVEFNTNANAQTLIPWIAGESGGFILAGAPWGDQDAANYAREQERKSDYVGIVHLKTQVEPWCVELRLVRTIDAKLISSLTASFSPAKPGAVLPNLAKQLLHELAVKAEIESQLAPPNYDVQVDHYFSAYLLRLEQLLAVRCSAMGDVGKNFIYGEREVMDGNVQLCLAWPGSVATRLLLLQTASVMKKVRPAIVDEFKDKLTLLQKEKPLPEPSNSVTQRILNELF